MSLYLFTGVTCTKSLIALSHQCSTLLKFCNDIVLMFYCNPFCYFHKHLSKNKPKPQSSPHTCWNSNSNVFSVMTDFASTCAHCSDDAWQQRSRCVTGLCLHAYMTNTGHINTPNSRQQGKVIIFHRLTSFLLEGDIHELKVFMVF